LLRFHGLGSTRLKSWLETRRLAGRNFRLYCLGFPILRLLRFHSLGSTRLKSWLETRWLAGSSYSSSRIRRHGLQYLGRNSLIFGSRFFFFKQRVLLS